MTEQSEPRHTFTGVHVYKRTNVFVPAVADELEEEGLEHTLLFRLKDGAWSHFPIAKAVPSVCVTDLPTPAILAMSADGEVSVYGASGRTIEMIDDSDEGPSELLQLRCIRVIGSGVYAAGLGRHVYRRMTPGRWAAVDRGVFAPRAEREVPVGFNWIDGLREDAIYAAGYFGEIWFYDGRRWIQQDSPTNVSLNGVCCVSEDEVVIGGMAGTVLRGANGRWEVIEQGETEKDFWGITHFRGQTYLSNYDGVFALEDGSLTQVDMGLPDAVSTAYLDAKDGVMWSVGHRDLAFTEDGESWTVVERPA
jgi:hypothetical protein